MRILRNKKLLILSITAVALLTLTLGVSYAYFTATVTGNDSAVVTKIVAGILDVDFTITDRISNDNILLIKDEKREEKAETLDFTVSNNGRGTLDAVYYVYLTDLNITNNLKSQDFKWELIKNDDTVFTGNFSSAETNTDFTITSETNNGIVIPVKQELSVGQIDRYKLRIWLSEKEEDQNSLLNGTFSGKVRVTSTQLTGSEKYVVFKDQSGTQLGKKIISDGKTNYTMDMSSVNLTGSTNIYCNNGGIPTLSNNTLSIDGVTNNVECKISNDIQDTFTNQLTTSKTGIVMTDDQDGVYPMIINLDKEVVLDLNGKEINSIGVNETTVTQAGTLNSDHIVFSVFGDFTINDSVGTGGAYTGTLNRVIGVSNNANLVINGGSFSGRQSMYVTGSNSHTEINGGTFNSKLRNTILMGYENTGSSIVINGGIFNNDASMAVISIDVSTNDVITINDGTFSSTDGVILNNAVGTINVNGGTFRGTNNYTINNEGTMNITGGDFQSSNNYTLYNKGTVNMSGGHIESPYDDIVYNEKNMNITGGVFISSVCTAIFNLKGTLNITQTDHPIYISSYYATANGKCAAIYDNTGGKANITANQANNCTSNYQDTTSGLCAYGNSYGYAVKTNRNEVTINGGTYISESTAAIVSESATYKIKNAYIKSINDNGISNSNYYVTNQSLAPGTFNICSSTIQGGRYDMQEKNTGANISYSNDNIFSNGTNTPASNKVSGTVNPTGAACSW